jgi:uncharacterized protein YndB with AHSA1/START domain
MRKALMSALLLMVLPPAAQAKQQSEAPVALTVIEERDGTRTLVHSVIIRAPVDKVWAAFATAEGWRSWAVPFAQVDFRVGGIIETSYDPAAKTGAANNIQNKILAYVPGRMLAFQAVKAPQGFPGAAQLPSLWNVAELEMLKDNRTRVRLSSLGYGRDAGPELLFQFFKQGNAESLALLQKSLEQAPVDWTKPNR